MPTRLIKMPIRMPRNSKFENLMLFIGQTVDTPAAAATATIIAKSSQVNQIKQMLECLPFTFISFFFFFFFIFFGEEKNYALS